MPLTSKGFEARRFSEIRDNIVSDLLVNLAEDIDASADTVLGVLINILASSVNDVEELAQAVSDNFNIDKAEGKYLDDLVALIGLQRLDESFSTGVLHLLSSNISSIIPAGTLFSGVQGNRFNLSANTSVSNLECTYCVLSPANDQGNFSVTIAGEFFNVTFGSSVSNSTIINGLVNEINLSAPTDYTVENENDTLVVNKIEKSNTFSVVGSPNLVVSQVEVIGRISAIEVGKIDPELDSITTILSPIDGLDEVTNYFKMTVGREKESDEDLRIRHSESFQISGSSTAPAIFSRLSNLTGVSQVRLFENKGIVTDSDGRPAKSFEAVVEGGDVETIGQTIYDTKPAGVETYGNNTTVVNDYAGNLTSVRWSRPSLVYVNARVTFTPYDEENFPDDGVDAIKEAVVAAGDSLTLDADVIPQRLFGPIYNAVEGIGTMTVEVGTSLNPSSATPDDIPYQTTPLSISSSSKADFDVVRVVVVQS